jgi:phosphatidylethanolamine/phosphatidyl-N-methylethanolamine N-methyltransferase
MTKEAHGKPRRWALISREQRMFFRMWLSNPRHIGAIAPSSRRLADAMARQVPVEDDGPVIELGGGTGVITAALLRAGISPSRLVVVERDPRLHGLLSERYPDLRIVLGDAARLVETLRPLGIRHAAAIVSGLPLLSIPRDIQDEILRGVFALLPPAAPFIQFTYGPFSPVRHRRLGVSGSVARRVARNLPPATVWVYRRPADYSQLK